MAEVRKTPVSFSQAIADEICSRLANGESMQRICVGDAMPTRRAVMKWLAANPEFRAQHEKAREDQADFYAEQVIDIADEATNDWKPGPNGEMVLDKEAVMRSRLRVDARKWYAGQVRPRKWGEHITQTHQGPDGGPVQFNVIDYSNAPDPDPV